MNKYTKSYPDTKRKIVSKWDNLITAIWYEIIADEDNLRNSEISNISRWFILILISLCIGYWLGHILAYIFLK